MITRAAGQVLPIPNGNPRLMINVAAPTIIKILPQIASTLEKKLIKFVSVIVDTRDKSPALFWLKKATGNPAI